MKKPPVHVTDHAVLRYMERVMGLDIEAVRVAIAAKVAPAVLAGACGLKSDGFNYRFAGGQVVTILAVRREEDFSGEPVVVKAAPAPRWSE